MIRFCIVVISMILLSCSQTENGYSQSQVYSTKDYDLIMPVKQEGLLVVFPCFPCDAQNTKEEFKIDEQAVKSNIAVLKMNFNMRLWLSQAEKNTLEFLLLSVIKKYNINSKRTYIGGFSSGGNVSLLLTDHLYKTKSALRPKGVFIVDSPIDLQGLYNDAQEDISKNYSEVAVNEANWIITNFEKTFGVGDTSLVHYQQASPYSSLSKEPLTNLLHLKGVDIRMYAEPDTLWWQTERKTDYKHMNAFYIEQLYNDLKSKYGKKRVEYITTEGKGYRSNGERHPHSWSIVDKKELIKWMK